MPRNPRNPNPDPEKFCSVIEAARSFKKTYHQVRDMYTTCYIDGIFEDGRLWLVRRSVAERCMEIAAARKIEMEACAGSMSPTVPLEPMESRVASITPEEAARREKEDRAFRAPKSVAPGSEV